MPAKKKKSLHGKRMGFFMDAETSKEFKKYIRKAKIKNKSREVCLALNKYMAAKSRAS
jgi:hypothetical protein